MTPGLHGVLHSPPRGGVREIEIQYQKIREIQPYVFTKQWGAFMEVQKEMVEERIRACDEALERYKQLVTKFRGEVKNDLSSVQAGARATEEAVQRMGKAYAATTSMLTTPEFTRALENAERMAVALKAISELQSHSITFAVLDRKG